MDETPKPKRSRLLFPLYALQDVDSRYLKKKKLSAHEAHKAFNDLFDGVLVYAFHHGDYNLSEFCDTHNITEECMQGIYTEEAIDRMKQKAAEHEMKFKKKSATVKIPTDYFWSLYRGDMSYFHFAVITAVMSRLGNTKKTGNKNRWQTITFQDIKTRMLGFTQGKDPIARAAVSSTHITDLRIKNVLQVWDDKLFYRFRNGRAYVYASKTNYNSKNEFIEHFATVKAKRDARRQFKAQSEAQYAARIYKAEFERCKILAVGETRTDTTPQEAIAQINHGIQLERSEMIAAITKQYGVNLYDIDTLRRHQKQPTREFRCIGEKLYSIVPITPENGKAIQAMLDRTTPPKQTPHPQNDLREYVESFSNKFDPDKL